MVGDPDDLLGRLGATRSDGADIWPPPYPPPPFRSTDLGRDVYTGALGREPRNSLAEGRPFPPDLRSTDLGGDENTGALGFAPRNSLVEPPPFPFDLLRSTDLGGDENTGALGLAPRNSLVEPPPFPFDLLRSTDLGCEVNTGALGRVPRNSEGFDRPAPFVPACPWGDCTDCRCFSIPPNPERLTDGAASRASGALRPLSGRKSSNVAVRLPMRSLRPPPCLPPLSRVCGRLSPSLHPSRPSPYGPRRSSSRHPSRSA